MNTVFSFSFFVILGDMLINDNTKRIIHCAVCGIEYLYENLYEN